MRRYGREIRAEFTKLGDQPSLIDTCRFPILLLMITPEGLIDTAYILCPICQYHAPDAGNAADTAGSAG